MSIYKYYFLSLLIFTSCSRSFRAISTKVDESQRVEGNKQAGLTFHDIRMKLFKKGKLSFFKNSDTVFMLESFNVEEGSYHGKIWTVKDSIEYTYRNNEFYYDLQSPFTKYMCKLIETWDTVGIRENEKLYSSIIPTQLVYGTKINGKQRNPQFYTIRFIRFFNADRDRLNALNNKVVFRFGE